MFLRYARTAALVAACLFPAALVAQGEDDLLNEISPTDDQPLVVNTFNGNWNINLPTNEVVGKGDLAFTIVHRFGDIASDETKGVTDLWGLDFVRDYRLALDYGVTERWMVGIGRSKQQSRFDANSRYQILRQRLYGTPLSITAYANIGLASELNTTVTVLGNGIEEGRRAYNDFEDRIDYFASLTIARKFGSFSAMLVPMFHYRTRVAILNYDGVPNDRNEIWALGIGTRWAFNKKMALTADYVQNFSPFRSDNNNTFALTKPFYYMPVAIGYEVNVGGHVFQMHLTNNAGVLPNSYLVNNSYNVEEGRFRMGFLLKRIIGLKKAKQAPVDTPTPIPPAEGK